MKHEDKMLLFYAIVLVIAGAGMAIALILTGCGGSGSATHESLPPDCRAWVSIAETCAARRADQADLQSRIDATVYYWNTLAEGGETEAVRQDCAQGLETVYDFYC